MKEFKLVPINTTNVTTPDVCGTESKSDRMEDHTKISGGGEDIMKQILDNKELDNHFKLVLLRHFAQKMDNKTSTNSEKPNEEDKSSTNTNLFEVIKNYIAPIDIPNTYRMFSYFVDKKDIQWNDKGIIKINNNKINLDIFKLFKYLSSRNMKIDEKDRGELERLLYSAHSMKPYIKNVHVIRLMEGVNNEVEDDIVVRKTTPMRTRSRKIKGDGVWFRW